MRISTKLTSMITFGLLAEAETPSPMRTRTGDKSGMVHLLYNRLSPTVLFMLLTALLFMVPNGKVHAQSGPRRFQMTLWEVPGFPATLVKDTDIHTSYGDPQPPGVISILVDYAYASYTSAAPSKINGDPVTWGEIVAVEVDEPYTSIDGYLNDSCTPPPQAMTQPIDTNLSKAAAALKVVNPKIRFWVNFTSAEAEFMQFCGLSSIFNRTYIDVISTDWYSFYFDDDLLSFYEDIRGNPAIPSQQVALIPGVFYTSQGSQLPYLQGYFNYANTANTTCKLPLGPQGVTGIYDGCPVWIVMGFLTGDITNPVLYGLLDGSAGAQPIKTAWDAEVDRGKEVVPPILKLLLQ